MPCALRLRVIAGWKADREDGECGEVLQRIGASAFVPSVQMGQPHPQERGLQLVEAAVGPDLEGEVSFIGPVVAESSHPGDDGGVVARHHPAITKSTQVLARVETPCRRIAKPT